MLYFSLKKIKFVVLILLIFTSINSVASQREGCNFNTSEHAEELSNLSKIKSIKITIDNYRKWTKNNLNAFISRESSILPKYKKNFLGTVVSKYKFGECTYRARIRLHGDWKDHIKFIDRGELVQSIDVKLISGSIANIVKFKLLLPETRFHENEIIISTILRSLDFLAPRTSLIDSEINNVKSVMLFQEKVSKEMLENMKRREGPLFEGDERFLFNNFLSQSESSKALDLENISLSKITNDEWASRNFINSTISLKSFSILQDAYLKYALNYHDDYILDWKILSNDEDSVIEKWAMYEMLLYATNSFHALRPHNRKFYFNSIGNGFEPIYYDGNPMNIGSSEILKIPDFKKYDFLKLEHFQALISSINAINSRKLLSNIEGNKFSLSKKKAENILKVITKKILKIRSQFILYQSSEMSSVGQTKINTNFFDAIEKDITKSIPNAYILKIDEHQKNDIFRTSLCILPDKQCINYDLNVSDVGKILERKVIEEKDLQDPLFINASLKDNSELKITKFKNSNIYVKSSNGMDIKFDELNSELNFKPTSQGDWALITKSDLTGIKINFNSKLELAKESKKASRINEFGLTGCITIHKSIFDDTSIEANGKNTKCEDVINIINANGKINKILVQSGSADGLDIDFSNLEIDLLNVTSSINDCADFSEGIYYIKHANFQDCGDKAISVGEQSRFKNENIVINNANIGVSSKDSSKTYLNALIMNNVQTCIEAYQKKQEFYGARVTFKNLNCPKNTFYSDTNSYINEL